MGFGTSIDSFFGSLCFLKKFEVKRERRNMSVNKINLVINNGF